MGVTNRVNKKNLERKKNENENLTKHGKTSEIKSSYTEPYTKFKNIHFECQTVMVKTEAIKSFMLQIPLTREYLHISCFTK